MKYGLHAHGWRFRYQRVADRRRSKIPGSDKRGTRLQGKWRPFGELPRSPDWFEFPCCPVWCDWGSVRHSPNTYRTLLKPSFIWEQSAALGGRGGLLSVETAEHHRNPSHVSLDQLFLHLVGSVAGRLRSNVRCKLTVRLQMACWAEQTTEAS